MPGSRFTPRTPEMLSPREHGEPLSINNKPLCPYCGEKEIPASRRFCSDECTKGKKKIAISRDFRRLVWQRDKGVCMSCGLDTVALGDLARTQFMQGGPHARSRATAIFSTNGYTREDKGRSLFVVVPLHKDMVVHIDNLGTICRPCTRLAAFNQQAYSRKRKFDKEAMGSLFSESEIRQAEATNPEGYSS